MRAPPDPEPVHAPRDRRPRSFLAAAVLLASCAATDAPPDSPRVVVLESPFYGCGAVEGLGCGLAIAPVLHRIDELPGVDESSVSWNGQRFRIELVAGADPGQVSAAALAVLEGDACCVTDSRGTAAPAADDAWFDEAGTVELSRHEAGVIASDFAAEMAAELALEPDVAVGLRAALREELERAFEAAHAAGGGVDRLWEQVPAATERFEARLVELLPVEKRAQAMAIVERELGE